MLFDDDWFLSKVRLAETHLNNFKTFNTLSNPSNNYYEFGAGWDLIIPIFMGLNDFNVKTIDIRRLFFPELTNKAIENYIKHKDNLKIIEKKELPAIPLKNEKDTLSYLEKYCNITYSAPCDARYTEYDDESIDFISSTATFEHIPVSDIQKIISECHRILKKGGIFSVKIDYRDHWAFFNRNLSFYNFFKYSEKQWIKYNPSLHYQNRMRHNDYLKIIEISGFKLLDERLVRPKDEERSALRKMEIKEKFKNYSLSELDVQQSTLVLIKPKTQSNEI